MSTPDVGPVEEQAILRAFRSGWVAPAGPELALFEAEIAESTGRLEGVALSSGTAALHLALVVHSMGIGDTVFCSTMTFAATANAIIYTGATPYFIDCDESGNMSPALLAQAIRDAVATGRRLGAVLVVDLLGKVADYEEIADIAAQWGIPVISDAAESLGSSRNGRPAGSFGSCAAVSFNGNKIVTSSGGGALVTDNPVLAERVRYLATQARQPVQHYEHSDIGYNYRLSNILAALGRAQLGRLPEFVEKRRRHRRDYRRGLSSLRGISIFGGDDREDNCWLTAILVDPTTAGITAGGLAAHLEECGIESRPLWKPMHLQPVFSDATAFPRLATGGSQQFFEQGLALPSGSNLEPEDIATVLDQIGIHHKESQGVVAL